MPKPPLIMTRPPTIQDRSLTMQGTHQQSVSLASSGSIPKRDLPTELFATCFTLVQTKPGQIRPVSPVTQDVASIDYATVSFNSDKTLGIMCGFWWDSSAYQANMFWSSTFILDGYHIVGRDTTMVPRSLLQAVLDGPQIIQRKKIWLDLYVLGGVVFDLNNEPLTKASFIRATSSDMASRLWRSSKNGLQPPIYGHAGLATALRVPGHWLQGVLQSPPMVSTQYDKLKSQPQPLQTRTRKRKISTF